MTRRVLTPASVFDSTVYGFSQAVTTGAGTTIHVSGQVAWSPDTGAVSPDLGVQVDVALANLASVLEAADARLRHVASLRIYVVEAAAHDLAPVSRALLRHFPTEPPAATWLVVSRLADPGMLVEVEATAVVPPDETAREGEA